MKLFNTNNIEIVKSCQECFSFELPSEQLELPSEQLELPSEQLELPSEQLAKCVVKFESKVKSVTV